MDFFCHHAVAGCSKHATLVLFSSEIKAQDQRTVRKWRLWSGDSCSPTGAPHSCVSTSDRSLSSKLRPPSNLRRVCLDVPDNNAKKGRGEFVIVSLGGNRGTITAARKSRDGSALSKTFQPSLRKTTELMQSKINIPRSALGKWGFVANLCKSGAVTFGVRPTSILL